MKVIIANNLGDYYREAAHIWLTVALDAIEKRGEFTVAISGGKTALSFFDCLTDNYFQSRLPWRETYLFWVDERCVPPHHPDSNFGAAKKNLLSKISLPESHIFRMMGEMNPPHKAAKSYEHSIKAHFKLEHALPAFDLIVLGMGEDGHTASLFPGTDALKEKDHWVVNNFVERLNSNRMSMTFPLINNADNVVVLCPDESKSAVVRDIFRTDPMAPNLPAKFISPQSGKLTWLLTSASAGKLPLNIRENAHVI